MDANAMRKIFLLKVEASGFTNGAKFNDREISDFLNMAQEEFVLSRFTPDANVKGKGFYADQKRRIDLSSLVTARVEYAPTMLMTGTAANRALRIPDADHFTSAGGGTSAANSEYAHYAEIPNEAIFILAATADVTTNLASPPASSTYYNIPTEFITYEQYQEWLRNPYKQPYHSLLWVLEVGDFTPASGVGASTVNSVAGLTGTQLADGTTAITFNQDRLHMLIPGKGYKVLKYYVHYVKMPASILVDVVNPANKIDCELPPHTHQEIVDIAVRMASASQVPIEARYQIADKEDKENQ